MISTIKKIVLAAVLTAVSALTAEAQETTGKSKMSPWLRSQFMQQKALVKKNGGPLRVKGRPVRNYILTLVKSSDEAATIREKGGVVLQDFSNGICAAFLPVDSLGVLNDCASIMRMEANEPSKLLNDTSAVILGVDKAWAGESASSKLPQAFTGKGVIAGVMDVGFDFTHPAFRNEDGTSRIKWFWDPLAPDANNDSFGMIYTSPREVLAARFCTNADISDHGTHVIGSMAGDGLDGHYAGMAPEADIMGAYLPLDAHFDDDSFYEFIKKHIGNDWSLDDAALKVNAGDVVDLVELYKIFEAADAAGQPCVVNWSFGSVASFFRDQTLYEEVLNQLLGPGHIVVAAAGNEGSQKTYVKKETNQPMEQFVYYGSYKGESHTISMRTKPDTDFKVGFVFQNMTDTLFINSRDVVEAQDTVFYSLPEVEVSIIAEEAVSGMDGFKLKLVFKGDYLDTMTDSEYGITKVDGSILIDTPVEVEILGSSTNSSIVIFNIEESEKTRGCNTGTMGYPASCERIITVGAMHHRTSFTNIWGETNTTSIYGSQEGHLVSFSSCGPTMNGRIKPDVVAPGYNIISALNSFYTVNHNDEETFYAVAPKVTYANYAFGKEYAMWAMSGTSMSSPIAAGVIALWLQAKPDLTPEEIKGVIARTSHQPEPEFSGSDKNVYYGWGEIDAYAGLLDILGLVTAIPELSHHQPAGVSFRIEGHTLYIDGLENPGVPVTVYDMSGRPLIKTNADSGQTAIDLTSVPSGVYAVQVGRQGSTLIRL